MNADCGTGKIVPGSGRIFPGQSGVSVAQRTIPKRLWYQFLHMACRIAAVAMLRIRCYGREHVPLRGGGLVLSNHQSNLDPVLVGLAADRRLNYLARDTLFGFAPFRWLIHSLDGIPIDREGLGLGGLKETLRRLKREELVLMFPEGTRTRDGEVAPLKPGLCALAKRGRSPVVPVGIAGAFDAWPRWNRLPRLTTIYVQFGASILPEEIDQLQEEELLALVERRIRECHCQAKSHRARAMANGLRSAS